MKASTLGVGKNVKLKVFFRNIILYSYVYDPGQGHASKNG